MHATEEVYPKWKYNPHEKPILVRNANEEKDLEGGWFDSPAEFGIETCPGVRPDREISKKKKLEKTGAK